MNEYYLLLNNSCPFLILQYAIMLLCITNGVTNVRLVCTRLDSHLISHLNHITFNSFLQITLDIPADGNDYVVYADVNEDPSNTSHRLHLEITGDVLTTINNQDNVHTRYHAD